MIVRHSTTFLFSRSLLVFSNNFSFLQEQAGDDYAYDKLKTTFECFQLKLRWVILQIKQKRVEKMRQLTLHGIMKQ